MLHQKYPTLRKQGLAISEGIFQYNLKSQQALPNVSKLQQSINEDQQNMNLILQYCQDYENSQQTPQKILVFITKLKEIHFQTSIEEYSSNYFDQKIKQIENADDLEQLIQDASEKCSEFQGKIAKYTIKATHINEKLLSVNEEIQYYRDLFKGQENRDHQAQQYQQQNNQQDVLKTLKQTQKEQFLFIDKENVTIEKSVKDKPLQIIVVFEQTGRSEMLAVRGIMEELIQIFLSQIDPDLIQLIIVDSNSAQTEKSINQSFTLPILQVQRRFLKCFFRRYITTEPSLNHAFLEMSKLIDLDYQTMALFIGQRNIETKYQDKIANNMRILDKDFRMFFLGYPKNEHNYWSKLSIDVNGDDSYYEITDSKAEKHLQQKILEKFADRINQFNNKQQISTYQQISQVVKSNVNFHSQEENKIHQKLKGEQIQYAELSQNSQGKNKADTDFMKQSEQLNIAKQKINSLMDQKQILDQELHICQNNIEDFQSMSVEAESKYAQLIENYSTEVCSTEELNLMKVMLRNIQNYISLKKQFEVQISQICKKLQSKELNYEIIQYELTSLVSFLQ